MYLFFFTPGEYSEVGEMKGGVKTNTKDMLKGKSDGKEIAVGQEWGSQCLYVDSHQRL